MSHAKGTLEYIHKSPKWTSANMCSTPGCINTHSDLWHDFIYCSAVMIQTGSFTLQWFSPAYITAGLSCVTAIADSKRCRLGAQSISVVIGLDLYSLLYSSCYLLDVMGPMATCKCSSGSKSTGFLAELLYLQKIPYPRQSWTSPAPINPLEVNFALDFGTRQ